MTGTVSQAAVPRLAGHPGGRADGSSPVERRLAGPDAGLLRRTVFQAFTRSVGPVGSPITVD